MKFLLIISLLPLISCSQKPIISTTDRLYQPKVIFLEANKTIMTRDGQYTPQRLEIWHSAQTVEDLESRLAEFK